MSLVLRNQESQRRTYRKSSRPLHAHPKCARGCGCAVGSCEPCAGLHIETLLRCYEPRGGIWYGSPMPRGEQIARPAERGTRLAGLFLAGPRTRAGDRKLMGRESECVSS